jgi:serine/threonine protein kinase
MTPEQWQKIEAVLQQALDLPSHERMRFVSEACNGDAELTREVNSLAEAYEESGDFIEAPALESDAEVLFSFGEDSIGREVGPYRIVERLGTGGMGEVYLAKDQRLDRSVALKILPSYLSDDIRLSRFRKEARAASGLNHPNIITIHEVGEHDSVRFIATEFIEGETLRELIARDALLPTVALEIAEQVCVALSAAHAAGIIHRDIKPENIMRRPDGIVKLLDFGIAKLTEPAPESSTNQTQTEFGVVMGTVNYMSPEQARGLTVDERSDIWSLGVVLYEMLTKRQPFTQSTRLDTMVAILERDPHPAFPHSGEFKALIDKCLSKDPSNRYQTAAELLAEIKGLKPQLEDFQIEKTAAVGSNTELATSLLPKRRRLLVAIAAVLLVMIIGAAVFAYWNLTNLSGRSNPPNAAPPAFKLYADMSDLERMTFIDSQEQRVSALMGDRPAKLNTDALQAIKQKVDEYVQRDGKQSSKEEPLPIIFERASPYLPTIGRSFRERNVPVIIGIYLAMVESEYLTCYESETGAKGLYQFMPGTAVHYGVARDEMCNADKMTPAAAHYLADRMAELGDDSQSLTLVLLSYTTGAESVRVTLRNLRASGNYDRTFWTMFDKRDTPDVRFQQETLYYVPTFFAVAIIGENPAVFGLAMQPLSSLAK